MIDMRDVMEHSAKINIVELQKRQRNSYAKRHRTGFIFKKNDKVLVRNLKRDDRKGGWQNMPWLGPYIIESVVGNNCVLKSGNKILKKKRNLCNLKPFKEHVYVENREENIDDKLDKEINKELTMQDDDIDKSNDTYFNDDVILAECVALNEDRVFNQTSKSWQIIKSKQLKLKFVKNVHTVSKRKYLGEPTATKNIEGDGNCLYRALCYSITGSENDHLILRKLISEV